MSTLAKAIAVAVDGHNDQCEKNGSPYVLHPLRVMFNLESEPDRIVGVLHDVVEDTHYTLNDLRGLGFSEEVLQAIDCVTKREGESYNDAIERVAANPIARRVKLADLEDNMDVRRLLGFTDKDAERMRKYQAAYRRLKDQTA